MRYKLLVFKQVDDFLDRLPNKLSLRINEKIEELIVDPHKKIQRLRGYKLFKYRIGKYRLIVEIEEEHKIVYCRYLDHRSKIYKRFRKK